jgi:hypothetical protein
MNHWKLEAQCLYRTGGLANFKREGTRAPCLPHGHSASSLHTGNITITWYMRNVFRVSNSQHIVAGPCTDPPFSAPVSRRRDVRRKSFQTLALPNDGNIIVARSKITDVAAIVIEVWHKPSSGYRRIAGSASRQLCGPSCKKLAHLPICLKWRHSAVTECWRGSLYAQLVMKAVQPERKEPKLLLCASCRGYDAADKNT